MAKTSVLVASLQDVSLPCGPTSPRKSACPKFQCSFSELHTGVGFPREPEPLQPERVLSLILSNFLPIGTAIDPFRRRFG
jgi:hypothetical protein